jgi:sulfate transport system ATP-binding protein
MNQGRIEQVGTPEQVYHEPATRFVYEFLGDVNIFHERSEDPRQGGVYVRPNSVDLARAANGPDSRRARVQRVHVAGPTVKVELMTESGDLVQADIAQEEQRRLVLARGDEVWVRPKEARSFDSVEDYSI